MKEIVPRGVEDLRARRFRQGMRNTIRVRLHYRKTIRGDEMVDFSVTMKPELTAKEMLRWKTASAKITR